MVAAADMVLFLGSSLLCSFLDFFGLFWGAYNAFKALKLALSSPTEALPLTKAALQFWAVWSALSIYNSYAELFVSWIPLYYEAKVLLLVWLLWPDSGAATFLFDRALDPSVKTAQAALVPRIALLSLRLHTRLLSLFRVFVRHTRTSDLFLWHRHLGGLSSMSPATAVTAASEDDDNDAGSMPATITLRRRGTGQSELPGFVNE